MPRKRLAFILAMLTLATTVPLRSASARDLVKATAAIALAQAKSDEPPPSRSQVLEKQRQEEAARVAVEPDKKVDESPYYKRWWFWALTAAVVGGTVALGVWAVEPTRKPAQSCEASAIACFGAGRQGGR